MRDTSVVVDERAKALRIVEESSRDRDVFLAVIATVDNDHDVWRRRANGEWVYLGRFVGSLSWNTCARHGRRFDLYCDDGGGDDGVSIKRIFGCDCEAR